MHPCRQTSVQSPTDLNEASGRVRNPSMQVPPQDWNLTTFNPKVITEHSPHREISLTTVISISMTGFIFIYTHTTHSTRKGWIALHVITVTFNSLSAVISQQDHVLLSLHLQAAAAWEQFFIAFFTEFRPYH